MVDHLLSEHEAFWIVIAIGQVIGSHLAFEFDLWNMREEFA